jgi:hypothetical protein
LHGRLGKEGVVLPRAGEVSLASTVVSRKLLCRTTIVVVAVCMRISTSRDPPLVVF